MDLEVWQIWVIGAIVLFIAEIFVPAFFLACFGVGCLVSALVSFLGMGVNAQILFFSGSTLVVFFAIRPFFLKYLYSSDAGVKTNVEALVGKTGLVTETIDPLSNSGRVIVGGEDWRGTSVDETVIEPEEKVVVVKVVGAKLLVKPAPNEKGME